MKIPLKRAVFLISMGCINASQSPKTILDFMQNKDQQNERAIAETDQQHREMIAQNILWQDCLEARYRGSINKEQFRISESTYDIREIEKELIGGIKKLAKKERAKQKNVNEQNAGKKPFWQQVLQAYKVKDVNWLKELTNQSFSNSSRSAKVATLALIAQDYDEDKNLEENLEFKIQSPASSPQYKRARALAAGEHAENSELQES